MNHEEWLNERRKGLGGSDSPVVLGVNPWKQPSELWAEKRGLTEEDEPSPAMKRGTALEPLVADLYGEATGRSLSVVPDILQHKSYGWMLANIDRSIDTGNGSGPGVLEIKCPGLRVFGQIQREGLPDYYIVQLQHYLEVTAREWGAFAVFNAERWELVYFDVERDEELIDLIIEKDGRFWEMVETNQMPDDGAPAVELPKAEPSEVLTLDTPDWKYAVQRLREAKSLMDEAKAVEDEAKMVVQQIMDQNQVQVVEGAGARIYWKFQKGRESFDKKALKKQHPDIYQKFMKEGSPFRAFRPYFIKSAEEE